MRAIHRIAALTLAMALPLSLTRSDALGQTAESQVIVAFQRAADAYAFAHRRTERRGAPPGLLVEGGFFTPLAAAEFRTRLRLAMSRGGCDQPDSSGADFRVPQVNASSEGSRALSPCIVAYLPKLPAELEFRSAGVALVLADAHLHVVVDVLHAAFPPRDN